MSALRRVSRSPQVFGEIARLHRAGFSMLPLGGPDGKSPICRLEGNERLPPPRILAPMNRTGSSTYGIRLGGLVVVDCDARSEELAREIEARFGPSSVHVRTPRGLHLYYAAGAGACPNLRGDGLPVDIKAGASSYVVGPHSVRPDGGAYEPVQGRLGDCRLSKFRDGNPPAHNSSERQPEGTRNRWLVQQAIAMVQAVNNPEELVGNLMHCRDEMCENPATISNAEVIRIAHWAWSCRLKGTVYHGRDSEFRMHRSALDALSGLANSSDAIALYVMLRDRHGHRPAQPFALSWRGVRDAGLTDLSQRRFVAARKALEGAELLSRAESHRAGHRCRAYRLNRLWPQMATAPNVLPLK